MILSVNPGSSSLKFKLFRHDLVPTKEGSFDIGKNNIKTHRDAVNEMLKKISASELADIKQICVRIVHGGDLFLGPCLVSSENLPKIEKYNDLAPLHNPSAVEVIKILHNKLSKNKLYCIFDTSFFALLPEVGSTYALPYKICEKEKIRRYGFHGISHQYVLGKVDPGHKNRLISIHLGAGCSVAAIDRGRPIDTSMGFTPTEGLVMLTRSGDLDPGLVLYMVKQFGYERAKEIIEKKSGLLGISGMKGGFLDLIVAAGEKVNDKNYLPDNTFSAENTLRAKLALKVFVSKIKKYIGAYAALMGGVDIIAFTGKVGFNSKYLRDASLQGLKFLDVKMIDLVAPDEELAMAKEIITMGL